MPLRDMIDFDDPKPAPTAVRGSTNAIGQTWGLSLLGVGRTLVTMGVGHGAEGLVGEAAGGLFSAGVVDHVAAHGVREIVGVVVDAVTGGRVQAVTYRKPKGTCGTEDASYLVTTLTRGRMGVGWRWIVMDCCLCKSSTAITSGRRFNLCVACVTKEGRGCKDVDAHVLHCVGPNGKICENFRPEHFARDWSPVLCFDCNEFIDRASCYHCCDGGCAEDGHEYDLCADCYRRGTRCVWVRAGRHAAMMWIPEVRRQPGIEDYEPESGEDSDEDEEEDSDENVRVDSDEEVEEDSDQYSDEDSD
ncbi:hypothetical protein B0T19DRAFT_484308 [Cercophora scortea]|uniref:Uncharacterized protein n=1 Tax=Cercophora scortea TaxID=314031 RepID=A0AAE0ILI0_9PEZI|nr:hypothetical protein B0T19DRAFT_484308 [Cercophora scortea]